ncbi:MAG: MerR family transcriptional regulator [Candidatus Omnitrophica bacterium]|nr:MerR family transcriptional regulator [Candidatus Omnitrophota bacterium]
MTKRRAMKKANALITARQIVTRFPVSYQTLNYYTTIGLLDVVKKFSNQRMYHEPEVRKRLKRISELKDGGYPLHLIRRVLTAE